MKNLFSLLVIITFFACDNSKEMEDQYYYNLDAFLEFSVFDSENVDLLDPVSSNRIEETDIKVFYLINGEKQEVNDDLMDYPKGFKIFKHENEYRIRIFLNHIETVDKPITYIQWGNDYSTDTIQASYKKTNNSLLLSIIWLNNDKVWERYDNTIDPYFTLKK